MDIIFGPYHKGGNHWTLIYVDVVNGTLLYIDPMRPRNENDTAQEFAHKWLEWALLHNSVCPDSAVPSKLTAVTTKHAVQRDGRNCGIFTMCVSVHGSVLIKYVNLTLRRQMYLNMYTEYFSIYFQFAKRLLEGTSVAADLVPGYEGAAIAAEILDASDSLRDLCAKCGQRLTQDAGPLVTCSGICAPRRTFHTKCIPASRRSDTEFSCQICNPRTREDFCFCCNGGPTSDIALCSNNDTKGCTNFVHVGCLGTGSISFSCGLC